MITSAHNPKIQRVRALLTRRQERDEAGLFVVEGVRLVEEAQAAGWQAELILHSQALSERGQALVSRFRSTAADIEEVPDHLMQSISGTETPQGILAVLRQRSLSLQPQPNFLLVIDAVRDPGNLGTLLRTAAAAGVQAVLLAPGSADAFSPKVLRSGMGAHFHLPILSLDWAEIHALCEDASLQLFLADAEQGVSCWSLNLRQPLALIIGGEAQGASPEARQFAHHFITIPMPGQSESLNAAIAASILLFEVVRQRSDNLSKS